MHAESESKTKRKQAMHALQALGAELVALPEAQRAALALPEGLAEAIDAARRMTRHEAKRRQLQLIGKLMRGVDAGPIRARLEALRGRDAQAAARHHALERWRARLLEDEAALTEFLAGHPNADAQALRAAIRNARKEAAEGRPPRAFRELFRLLREAAGGTAGADA